MIFSVLKSTPIYSRLVPPKMVVPRDSKDIQAMITARDAVFTRAPDTDPLAATQAVYDAVTPAITTGGKVPEILTVNAPMTATMKGAKLTINRQNNTFVSTENPAVSVITPETTTTGTTTDPNLRPIRAGSPPADEPLWKDWTFYVGMGGFALIIGFMVYAGYQSFK